jgi:hypothetical protein
VNNTNLINTFNFKVYNVSYTNSRPPPRRLCGRSCYEAGVHREGSCYSSYEVSLLNVELRHRETECELDIHSLERRARVPPQALTLCLDC